MDNEVYVRMEGVEKKKNKIQSSDAMILAFEKSIGNNISSANA